MSTGETKYSLDTEAVPIKEVGAQKDWKIEQEVNTRKETEN